MTFLSYFHRAAPTYRCLLHGADPARKHLTVTLSSAPATFPLFSSLDSTGVRAHICGESLVGDTAGMARWRRGRNRSVSSGHGASGHATAGCAGDYFDCGKCAAGSRVCCSRPGAAALPPLFLRHAGPYQTCLRCQREGFGLSCCGANERCVFSALLIHPTARGRLPGSITQRAAPPWSNYRRCHAACSLTAPRLPPHARLCTSPAHQPCRSRNPAMPQIRLRHPTDKLQFVAECVQSFPCVLSRVYVCDVAWRASYVGCVPSPCPASSFLHRRSPHVHSPLTLTQWTALHRRVRCSRSSRLSSAHPARARCWSVGTVPCRSRDMSHPLSEISIVCSVVISLVRAYCGPTLRTQSFGSLRHLRRLSLIDCAGLTDASINAMLARFASLSSFGSPSDVSSAAPAIPQDQAPCSLTALDLSRCRYYLGPLLTPHVPPLAPPLHLLIPFPLPPIEFSLSQEGVPVCPRLCCLMLLRARCLPAPLHSLSLLGPFLFFQIHSFLFIPHLTAFAAHRIAHPFRAGAAASGRASSALGPLQRVQSPSHPSLRYIPSRHVTAAGVAAAPGAARATATVAIVTARQPKARTRQPADSPFCERVPPNAVARGFHSWGTRRPVLARTWLVVAAPRTWLSRCKSAGR